MNEETEYNIPSDADDLRKHAPALFDLKERDTNLTAGFVVPENYFEDLEGQIHSKIILPTETGLTVPEKYFEELNSQLESSIYLEEKLPKTQSELPSAYFESFDSELPIYIALDNLKQDDGFGVPENYFALLTDKITSRAIRENEEVYDSEVPENYFENLPSRLVSRIENEETKVPTKQSRIVVFAAFVKHYSKPLALAASAALLAGIAWFAFSNGDAEVPNTNVVADNHKDAARKIEAASVESSTIHKQIAPAGVAKNNEKKPKQVKPSPIPEVQINEEEIVAQSDLMDESMLTEYLNENQTVLEDKNDMMDYLLDDQNNLDLIDPGN